MKRTPIRRFGIPKSGYTFVGGKMVKPKAKKRPKSERTRLRKQLDSLFSLYIRTRDKRKGAGKCIFACGRPIEVAFHFVSRGNLGTRWDPRNAVGSCRGCNYSEAMDRREERKAYWRGWHVALVGEATRLDLEAKAKQITKLSDADLEGLLADIKGRLERVCLEVPGATA